MPYALSSSPYGRASGDAVSPLRAATRMRKPAASLDQDEQRQLDQLKARDGEVRAREKAHKTATGAYANRVSYDMKRGPDGQLYAVSGETAVDVSPVPGDPEATIKKMEVIRLAALTTGAPSAQDRADASRAMVILNEAEAALREEDRGPIDSAESRKARNSLLAALAVKAYSWLRGAGYEPAVQDPNPAS